MGTRTEKPRLSTCAGKKPAWRLLSPRSRGWQTGCSYQGSEAELRGSRRKNAGIHGRLSLPDGGNQKGDSLTKNKAGGNKSPGNGSGGSKAKLCPRRDPRRLDQTAEASRRPSAAKNTFTLREENLERKRVRHGSKGASDPSHASDRVGMRGRNECFKEMLCHMGEKRI